MDICVRKILIGKSDELLEQILSRNKSDEEKKYDCIVGVWRYDSTVSFICPRKTQIKSLVCMSYPPRQYRLWSKNLENLIELGFDIEIIEFPTLMEKLIREAFFKFVTGGPQRWHYFRCTTATLYDTINYLGENAALQVGEGTVAG